MDVDERWLEMLGVKLKMIMGCLCVIGGRVRVKGAPKGRGLVGVQVGGVMMRLLLRVLIESNVSDEDHEEEI